MKKKIFLLLIAPLALMSCKKDQTETEETIIGKWSEKSLTYEYYNSAGVKVFTENDPGDGTWEFTEKTVTNTATGSNPFTCNYVINNVNGKKKLVFSEPNIVAGADFELTSLTKNSMTWGATESNVQYYDGSVKTAAKATLVVTFSR